MKILLVEDDISGMAALIVAKLKVLYRKFPTAEITLVPKLQAARDIVAAVPHPDIVILDLTLDDATWDQTILHVPEMEQHSRVIIVTGQPENMVREALNRPEIEIIHKDSNMFDRLLGAIVSAFRRSRASDERMEENIRKIEELLPHAAPQ